MLKEQLFGLAMRAVAKAHETRQTLKETINSDHVKAYVKTMRDMAIWVIENKLQASAHNNSEPVNAPPPKAPVKVKKPRKTSIRPAKEIVSPQAEKILQSLKKTKARLVKNTDELEGKKSLAYLVWALGHAERAKIKEGISVHDVSALLYRACKIELYPINISRVVHGNQSIVRQINQDKQSKTYLLTELGEKTFKEKFLA